MNKKEQLTRTADDRKRWREPVNRQLQGVGKKCAVFVRRYPVSLRECVRKIVDFENPDWPPRRWRFARRLVVDCPREYRETHFSRCLSCAACRGFREDLITDQTDRGSDSAGTYHRRTMSLCVRGFLGRIAGDSVGGARNGGRYVANQYLPGSSSVHRL